MAPSSSSSSSMTKRSTRFSTTVVSPAPEVRNSQDVDDNDADDHNNNDNNNNKMPDVEEILTTPASISSSSIGANGITNDRSVKKDCSDVAPIASVSPEAEEEQQESENGTVEASTAVALVPSSTPTTRSVDERNETKTPPKARRTLFHTSNRLVTPSQSSSSSSSSLGRKRSGTETGGVAAIQPPPPAKRRLIFGKWVDQIQYNPNVKTIYGIVRKLTGSIGGNGYSGPIYGELTMGSMQKMINLMMTHTHLNRQSRFIDVGSGIGKPNLHVAQYPGVEFSCGVEMEHVRWSLGMTCLHAILNAAAAQPAHLPADEAIQCRCIFLHRNIKEARTFDPFTHVYMFSIGFPPPLWVDLSEMWNRSQSEYLICYHSPKNIMEEYEFEVELLAQTPTSMHGSKEGHTGYLYQRKSKTETTRTSSSSSSNNNEQQEEVPCDGLFADAWNLVKGGREALSQAVKSEMNESNKVAAGPKTRSRNNSQLTRV